MKKILVVLLERNFRNVLQNKSNVKPQEQHVSFPKLKPEPLVTGSDQNHRQGGDQNIRESADCDVVEIFAQDIVDVSSEGEDEFMPVAYKIEEDEWYGLGDPRIRVINKEEIYECHDNKSVLKAEDGSKNNNFVEKDGKLKDEHLDNNNFGIYEEFDNLDSKADVSDFEIKENDISDHSDDNKDKTSAVSDINGNDFNRKKDPKCNKKKKKGRMSKEDDPLLNKARFYVCTLCEFKVKTITEKSNHRRSHSLRYLAFKTVYECPECEVHFDDRYAPSALKIHYYKHEGQKAFPVLLKECPECPYKPFSKRELSVHLLSHKRNGEFRCEYCTFSSDHSRIITNHLKLHTDFPRVFSCKYCSYTTQLRSSLYRHETCRHLSDKEKKWAFCPHCPYKVVSASSSNLRKHIKCHESSRGYKCPQCTYASVQIVRVRKHIEVHYDKSETVPEYAPPKEEKPIRTCQYCPYKTKISNHLNRHVLIHDESKGRVQCADCPFTCKDKADMISHVKWHKKSSNLKCTWCSFSHFNSGSMTRHQRVHQDYREIKLANSKRKNKDDVKCPVCKEIVHSPSYMKRHMITHQTADEYDETVYCANCPHKSKTKTSSFIRHVQAHLKRDGIKCDYCTYRHDLRRCVSLHILKAHPEYTYLESTTSN